MQTKLFLCAALFSAISLVTAEPTPQPAPQDAKTPTAAQSTKLVHDGVAYFSSVTAAPQWPSYSSVIYDAVSLDLYDLITESLSDITAEPGYTDLPNNVQSFIVSVKNAEESIISKDLSGAALKPTGAVMAAGAAAAGLVGFVAML